MKRNRRLGLFLLFLLLSIGVLHDRACAAELTIDSDEQLRIAREAYQRGEYQRAIVELERFLHFFPQDENVPRVRYLIGLSHLKAKQYDAARRIFDEVVNSYPRTDVAGQSLFMIAESYYMQGAFDQAEKIYRQIIDDYPDTELGNRAAYRLGWTLMQKDQWKEASRAFGDVPQASPLFPSARDLSRKSLLGEEIPSKDPVTAGILSALLPGLGHAYTDRYKDAMVAFLLNGVFIFAAYESFNKDLNALGGALAFLELGWYSGGIYSAVNSAHKYNRAKKNAFLQNLRDNIEVGLYSTKEGHIGLALRVAF